MGKWLALIVLLLSSVVLGFLYLEAQNTSVDFQAPDPKAVRVVHSFQDGVHRYSGGITLPHSCYDVNLDEAPQESTTHHILKLTAIDRMLDQRLCAKIPTRYPFETVIDAPENITTSMMVNNIPVPIILIESGWVNPKGTLVNTAHQ